MNKSFKTFFFLKKGHGYQGGPMPIYLRITINGRQKEMTTQRSCEPTKWNQAVCRLFPLSTYPVFSFGK